VTDALVTVLANYRSNTPAGTASSRGQLLLPDSLRLLPLFVLSLRKSRMMRAASDANGGGLPPYPSADERAYHLFHGRQAGPDRAVSSVHPCLYRVSDMRDRDGTWTAPPELGPGAGLRGRGAMGRAVAASLRPVCQLPRSVNPSVACLDESGIYVLDDGFAMYLLVGRGVPESTWREVVDVPPAGGSGGPRLSSSESGARVRSVLRQLRRVSAPNGTVAMAVRPTCPTLVLVFAGRGSAFEREMDRLLVDDPTEAEGSYPDFLVGLHASVNSRLSAS